MTPQGLRDRKKRDTRRRIEDAALALFARDGYDDTTIDAIAAAADIAPRTFFHYFPTKEDVVLADHAERIAKLCAALGQRPASEGSWEALRQAFKVVAADYQDEVQRIGQRLQITVTAPSIHARSLQLQAAWEPAIATVLVQRDPQLAGDITATLLAATALAAMRASIQHWLTNPTAGDLPEVLDHCFGHLATGLQQSPERRRRPVPRKDG